MKTCSYKIIPKFEAQSYRQQRHCSPSAAVYQKCNTADFNVMNEAMTNFCVGPYITDKYSYLL